MADHRSFTVMTMNLRFGLAEDKENAWDLRKGLVRQFLMAHPADIIGFQEVNHFQADFLETCLQDHGHRGWHNRHLPWWQSNMVFFGKMWTCLGFRHHFLSPFPDILSKLEGSKWPRQCVAAWLERKGKQILAVNTHFDFDPRVQAKSAALVLGFIDRFPPGLPVVLTGDFNAHTDASVLAVFQAGGFKEVFDGKGTGTYHGFSGVPDGRHIDWILYRGGITPAAPRVLAWGKKNRFPSDHFPVACDFSWDREGETV